MLEIIFVLLLIWMEKLGSLAWFKFPQPIKIILNTMKVSNLKAYIWQMIFKAIYLFIFSKKNHCENIKTLYICFGKSYTTSSCWILQGGNAAKVDGWAVWCRELAIFCMRKLNFLKSITIFPILFSLTSFQKVYFYCVLSTKIIFKFH